MVFNKSVLEIMQKRQSIRTYATEPISESHYRIINDYISSDENLIGPFGGKSSIELVKVMNNVTNKGIKLGTYGFIKKP